jgi:hypothetical protein
MSDTGIFIVIISFMVIFNGFMAFYAISDTNYEGITIPDFPENPSIIDYVLIPFQYIFFFFKLTTFAIFEMPPFVGIFTFIMDVVLVFILVKLARGV